ncbi:von Willebrand factor A domain-containing protein 5A [Balamuthia mandrillaris]
MATQQEKIASFQAVAGADETTCNRFLSQANWDLERALSNYFDAGLTPPDVLHTPTAATSLLPPTAPSTSTSTSTSSSSDLFALPTPKKMVCGLFCRRPPPIHLPVPVPLPPPTTTTTTKEETEEQQDGALPLHGVQVKAHVKDLLADVEISQRFFNDYEEPIEAVFRFKQDDSTVYALEAVLDGKRVIGEAKEKQEAADTYDDGIASGHNAFLLDKESSDGAFKLSVGNLPPKKEAILTIRYISELFMEGEAIRMQLPITSIPLHSKQAGGSEKGEEGSTTTIKDGLHVDIDFEMGSNIVGIESESGHQISWTVGEGEGNASLKYALGEDHNPGTPLTLLIGLEDPHSPKILVEKEPGKKDRAAMLRFYPNIDMEDEEVITEMIFLVDRSGSMAGSRMRQTKNALRLFLHSLPLGTLFNVIGFGSRHETMFTASREYNDQSLAEAIAYVNRMEANLGGTSILPPLRHIFGTDSNPDYPRQIFLLTDGDVDNTDEVISFVQKSCASTRVFTFGIGAEASAELVRGVASAGKGQAEFVASGERLESKVLRQLKRALQPILKNVSIEWGELKLKRQTPQPLPPIFHGQSLVVFALLEDDGDDSHLFSGKASVVLKASTGEKELEFALPLGKQDNCQGNIIHRFAARSIVQDLEGLLARSSDSAEQVKDEVIRLATSYGLVTKYTSFVAIAEGDEAAEGTMKHININSKIISSLTGKSLQRVDSASSEEDEDAGVDLFDAGISTETRVSSSHSGFRYSFAHPPLAAAPAAESSLSYASAPKKSAGGFGGGGVVGGLLGLFGSSAPKKKKNKIGKHSRKVVMEKEAKQEGASGGRNDEKRRSSSGSRCEAKEAQNTSSYDSIDTCFTQEKCFAAEEECCAIGDTASFDDFAYNATTTTQAAPPPPPGGRPTAFAPSPDAGAPAPPRSSSLSSSLSFFSSNIPTSTSSISTSTPIDPHMSPMDRFVALQRANGSWALDETFFAATQLTANLVQEKVRLRESEEEEETSLVATALAIIFLEVKFPQEKEQWELVAAKALRWLRRECKKVAGGTDADALLEQARACLGAL